MIEALWSVDFVSNVTKPGFGNFGNGIVVLETGRVLGGDTQFTYIGSYSVPAGGGVVTAEIEVRKYNTLPGMSSVFGELALFHLKLSGAVGEKTMTMSGHMIENPALTLTVKFHRRAELP